MEDKQQPRRISTGVLAGAAALVLAVGGGTAWWAMQSQKPPKAPPVPAAIVIPPSPVAVPTVKPTQPIQTAQPTQQPSAKIYWLKDAPNNTDLVEVAITLDKSAQPSQLLEAAFNRLLTGPAEPGTFSVIPQGTKLRSVTVKEDGVHLDLSREFTSGGGSASMVGRLAQVVYTATSTDPNGKLWMSVDGQPLKLLGGEGLEVAQPMTRQIFEKEFGQ